MTRSYYGSSGRRVLIVDDEEQLIGILRRFLERLGYEAASSGEVEDAWRLLTSEPDGFAVAIVDMVMPEPGGAELARRILETYPAMRVIVTSGYPTDIAGLEALGAGRVAFLHKPFTPEMLGSTLRGLLG